MKRPLQHIIEEESRKEFANIIPNGWATNDFTKDYGKDIQLEIFKDYESTGNLFICQLKGSTQEVVDENISVQMEVSHLVYFSTIPLPVLLVFYSTRTKEFWAIWANKLHSTLNLKSNQKKVSIKLGSTNKISNAFFNNLTEKFDKNLPRKINLVFDGKSDFLDVIRKKMLLWMDNFFAGHFEIKNHLLPLSTHILVIEDKGQLYTAVTGPYNQGILDPVSVSSDLSSLFRNKIDERPLCELESGLLYLLGSAFAKHSFKGAIRSLSYCLHNYVGRYKSFPSLLAISEAAVADNCIMELQRLIDNAIINDNYDDFQALNYGLFKADNNRPTLRSMYERNIIAAIEGLNDGVSRGTLCYNLGSLYRNTGDYYLAGTYYQKARKLYPEYLSRSYWWMEYAGILALAGHYRFSGHFYKKFIELDPINERFAFSLGLLADVQFRDYQFSNSLESIDSYLNEVAKMVKLPDMIFVFMRDVITWLKESGFADGVYDLQKSDQFLEQEISNPENGFMDSIKADPLNYSSLFNQAKYLINMESWEEALPFLKASAVISNAEIEIWVNYIEVNIRLEDFENAFLVFLTMIQVFGPTITNELTDRVASSTMPLADKQKNISNYQTWEEKIREELLSQWYRPPAEIVRMPMPEKSLFL